ncbi:MAG: hypothetical protein LBF34_03715 [Puniceicoccales bacterium]|nr:hypothetical protein [Puniceicoccales bacterium]
MPKKLDPGLIEALEKGLKNRAATQMKKDKPNILKDILVGKRGRQQNAQELAAKTGTYGADAGRATAQFNDEVHKVNAEKSGYLNALEGVPITVGDKILPPKTGDKAVERARIQGVYDQAYKAGGQAQKSADEISGALQQAVPKGVMNGTHNLGTIGGPITRRQASYYFRSSRCGKSLCRCENQVRSLCRCDFR